MRSAKPRVKQRVNRRRRRRFANKGIAHLEGDRAADWLLLFRHVHNTETAFADLLQQLVRADDGAGTLRHGRVRLGWVTAKGLAVERPLAFGVGFQKQGRLAAQLLVPGARLVQVGVPLLRSVPFHGGIEDSNDGRKVMHFVARLDSKKWE